MKIKLEQEEKEGAIASLAMISRVLDILEEDVYPLNCLPETQAQLIKLVEVFNKEAEVIVEGLLEEVR